MDLLAQIARRCRCGGRRCLGPLGDAADKAQPLAWNGSDQGLLLAAVADRLAGGRDAAGQRRVRHDSPVPDPRDHVVLGDDVVAVADQINKQIKDLRLDLDKRVTAAKFAALEVERAIGKMEEQGHLPRLRPSLTG